MKLYWITSFANAWLLSYLIASSRHNSVQSSSFISVLPYSYSIRRVIGQYKQVNCYLFSSTFDTSLLGFTICCPQRQVRSALLCTIPTIHPIQPGLFCSVPPSGRKYRASRSRMGKREKKKIDVEWYPRKKQIACQSVKDVTVLLRVCVYTLSLSRSAPYMPVSNTFKQMQKQ